MIGILYKTIATILLFITLLTTLAVMIATDIPEAQYDTYMSVATQLYNTTPRVTQDLHGLTGYEGIDVTMGCGYPLSSPSRGTVIYVGLDGYNHIDSNKVWPQSSMVTIKYNTGSLTLLHLLATVDTGQTINAGDIIGYENSIGWSTGCHTHVSWKPNKLEYGKLVKCSLGYCRMSSYVPSLGGINCDVGGDCLHTANGSNVHTLLSSGNTYCAAPKEVPYGTVVSWEGGHCIKADTGGWILKIEPNEFDPACSNAIQQGFISTCGGNEYNITGDTYYWIDILEKE